MMLVALSFKMELYNHEMMISFARDQAANKGSLSEGVIKVPLMSIRLLLTERVTLIAWLQVM